jgi:geranylgeranyl diphosphate synthase type I
MVEPVYARFLPAIEDALREHWNSSLESTPAELRSMIAYHMGWENDQTGKGIQGKRIRPALILLVMDACGKDWYSALPAAVAVEWLHNFSLIHDDIQDQSVIRHGRDTLWKRWGIPQAINTGDALFTLAFLSLANARKEHADSIVAQLITILAETCLQLTEGQHLDMSFENRELVSEAEYLRMIHGKTAALLGCCMKMGAVLSSLSMKQQLLLEKFGDELGLAFQIQDDCLGIWGDQQTTGKSTNSDLASGKKTLPVLHALADSQEFRSAWQLDHSSPKGIEQLLALLTLQGSSVYAKGLVHDHTQSALDALHDAFQDKPTACHTLENLTTQLINRDL